MRCREQRLTLWLACGSTLLALVAFVTPQATVSRTVAAFDGGAAAAPWMLSSMPLGLAVALLPAGAFGDDSGRRRVFALGLVLLALGGSVCALSGSTLVFVAGRLLQGAGAAAVLACGLGLIAHAFPEGPGRSYATGVWGASLGGGIATGGLLPVLVDPGESWRVSYAVVAMLAVTLAVACRAVLVESRVPERRAPDVAGAALLGVGVAALLAGLIQSRQDGLTALVLALWLGGAGLLAGFVLTEARVAAPMLDLGLFRRRPFLAAIAGAVANGAGGTALVSYLPTVVQAGLGRSLLVASLLTLLFAGTSVLTALQVRRLPARVSGRLLLTGGLFGVAAGQVALTGLSPASTVLRLVPGLLLGGLAYGVLNAALGREAVASVPAGRASLGSGANNTARYLASAVGVAVVALIAPVDGAAGTVGLVSGWNTAALVTAAVSIVGATTVLALRPRSAAA